MNAEGRLTVVVEQLPHAEGLMLPSYATEGSVGMDLLAAVEKPVKLWPHERRLVPTGLKIAVPEGYEMQIRPRSGLALKHGLTIPNTPGTIDADYRGEVQVIILNLGAEPFTIRRGDRIAQMVLTPVSKFAWKAVEHVPPTSRGEGGFGHTGLNNDSTPLPEGFEKLIALPLK